ncbi:DUF1127 domain-containing protein [Primorskyibacter sedentarius]|uniref:Uncharacterized protein YjiS (DUF1127 family) n=1 Tax=Primorskyibacter sedentarius TaxID=745311 RepID=A0A4R3J3A7_9RHOB|nr:DUF1127 domain-containing protein [Primorskyibacter sedentarius]TCS59645.1 uncharacterized protein YjiS (DUF1127 family) [Primorskyibacter sedentarius]
MAATDTTRTHFHTVLLADRIGHALADIYTSFKAWNEERQTRKALQSLTDYELADIGLTRGDIDAVSRGR